MNKTAFKIGLIGCLVAIAYFVGIYLDEFTDIIFSTIFTGLFQTKPGTIFNNYECLFVISKLVQNLQGIFTNVNMYGIILTAINTFCIYSIILIFKENIFNRFSKAIGLFIFLNIFVFILHDFVFIQFTKTAMFCNFLGLYYLIYESKKTARILFLIICGILLRTETFWLVFIFTLIILSIVEKKNTFEIIFARKYLWFVIILIGILSNIFNKKTYTADDNRYESFRTYKYTLFDFTQTTNKKALLSKQDSIKLYTLKHAFFIDTDSLLNEKVLNKLAIEKHNRFDLNSFFNTVKYKQNLIRANQNINELLKYYNSNYILWFLCSLFIAIILFQQKQKKSILKIFLILLMMLLIILSITIYIKMENRVLSPILLISLFYFIVATAPFKSSVSLNKIIFIPAIFMVIAQLYFSSEFYFKYKHREKLHQQSRIFIQNWNSKKSDKILVPDLFSWEIFFSKALTNTTEIKKINLFSIDEGYLSMMENYLDFMNNSVKSNHYKDYLNYLIKNKERVYFLGSEDRMQILRSYVYNIYNIDLKFTKTNESSVIDEQGTSKKLELYFYKLEN